MAVILGTIFFLIVGKIIVKFATPEWGDSRSVDILKFLILLIGGTFVMFGFIMIIFILWMYVLGLQTNV